MKYLILLLIILGAGAGAYFYTNQASVMKDPCDAELVQNYIEEKFVSLNASEEGRDTLAQVDKSIEDGFVDKSKRDDTIKATIELAYKTENSCAISDDLKYDATEHYIFNPEGGICPPDKFDVQTEKDFQDVKADPNYKYFMEKAFSQISAQIQNPTAQANFIKKWESDEAFQKKMLKALFDVSLRKKHNCTNAMLPMVSVTQELMKEE